MTKHNYYRQQGRYAGTFLKFFIGTLLVILAIKVEISGIIEWLTNLTGIPWFFIALLIMVVVGIGFIGKKIEDELDITLDIAPIVFLVFTCFFVLYLLDTNPSGVFDFLANIGVVDVVIPLGIIYYYRRFILSFSPILLKNAQALPKLFLILISLFMLVWGIHASIFWLGFTSSIAESQPAITALDELQEASNNDYWLNLPLIGYLLKFLDNMAIATANQVTYVALVSAFHIIRIIPSITFIGVSVGFASAIFLNADMYREFYEGFVEGVDEEFQKMQKMINLFIGNYDAPTNDDAEEVTGFPLVALDIVIIGIAMGATLSFIIHYITYYSNIYTIYSPAWLYWSFISLGGVIGLLIGTVIMPTRKLISTKKPSDSIPILLFTPFIVLYIIVLNQIDVLAKIFTIS